MCLCVRVSAGPLDAFFGMCLDFARKIGFKRPKNAQIGFRMPEVAQTPNWLQKAQIGFRRLKFAKIGFRKLIFFFRRLKLASDSPNLLQRPNWFQEAKISLGQIVHKAHIGFRAFGLASKAQIRIRGRQWLQKASEGSNWLQQAEIGFRREKFLMSEGTNWLQIGFRRLNFAQIGFRKLTLLASEG